MKKAAIITILKNGGRIGRYGHIKNASGATVGKCSRATIDALLNEGRLVAVNLAWYELA